MGHHKHNPTAIAAKKGEIEPKAPAMGKGERERLLMREIEQMTAVNIIRNLLKEE